MIPTEVWVLTRGGEAIGVFLSLGGARDAAFARLGVDEDDVSEDRSDRHGEVVTWDETYHAQKCEVWP